MTELHSIEPSDLVNLRELGGLRVHHGRVRPGLLWRSDDAATITDAQAAVLAGHGLRAVVDLRSPEELAATGRGPLGSWGVTHHHLPLLDWTASPGQLSRRIDALGDTPWTVGAWYAQVAADRARALVAGLNILAASTGAVLFHCAAGKDRTGIFAAALLSVLGASHSDIAAEYARTDAAMPRILNRLGPAARQWLPGDPASAARGGALLAAPAETMLHMLDCLDADHGGFEGVLASAGLETRLQQALQDRFVEAHP